MYIVCGFHGIYLTIAKFILKESKSKLGYKQIETNKYICRAEIIKGNQTFKSYIKVEHSK